MALKDDYPALDQALTELAYSVNAIKHGMADGKLSVDEIVTAIPDQRIRDGVAGQLKAVTTMFTEMGKLSHAGPWTMLRYAPDIFGRLAGMFQ